MSGKLLAITADGSRSVTTYPGKEPPIEVLQKLCGGYVQQIPVLVNYGGQKCCCFADEEGKLKDYPVNHEATRLCQPHLIVGTLVVDIPDKPGQRGPYG